MLQGDIYLNIGLNEIFHVPSPQQRLHFAFSYFYRLLIAQARLRTRTSLAFFGHDHLYRWFLQRIAAPLPFIFGPSRAELFERPSLRFKNASFNIILYILLHHDSTICFSHRIPAAYLFLPAYSIPSPAPPFNNDSAAKYSIKIFFQREEVK